MTLELLRSFLTWCTVINFSVLLIWFAPFALGRAWVHRLHGRWFQMSREQFDAVHYGGMALFKLGIVLFNLVPSIVLWMLG